jgi:hypothetical protein
MADFTDNEDLDAKKKALEIEKLQKELIKIDHETIEIRWKKWSAWGPTAIAIISLFFVWANGFLDAKSALVKAETLNLEGKRDALNLKIKLLDNKVDSLESISLLAVKEINKREGLIVEMGDKIGNLGKKNLKYLKLISSIKNQIKRLESIKDSVNTAILNAEDCFLKAREFMKHCILYDEYEPALYNQEFLVKGYKPPYRTRFTISLEEVANLNIASMNYAQFLKDVVGYKQDGRPGMAVNDYIKSSDNKVTIIVRSNFGNFQQTARNNISDLNSQFECYKSLSKSQKIKLLNQMIIRQ